jgi:undecaprenyl-diphosphatase
MSAPSAGRARALRAALALLVAVAALFAWVQHEGGLPGEIALYRWVHGPHMPPALRLVCAIFAALAAPPAAISTALGLGLILRRRVGAGASRFLLVAATSGLVARALKHTIGPTAPWHVLFPATTTGSFPSGHVVYATALFGAIALQHPRRAPVCWAIVAAMGPARVLDGAHLVSDVLAGYGVGFAWLLAQTALWPAWARVPVIGRAPAPEPAPA